MLPNRVIPMFDSFLAERAVGQLDLVVIGGTALNLLRVVQRDTRDCDVLTPALADAVLQLSREFAAVRRSAGEKLIDEWLNNGPASLVKQLPDGWDSRLVSIFTGSVLTLRTLGRADLLKTKLFAFCDRGGHDLEDCLAMAPTAAELAEALPWVQYQDANPDWPAWVQSRFEILARRLGHGI